MRETEVDDDTMWPPAGPEKATPGYFCTPCTRAGRVGQVAHRVIIKGGKPFGLCVKCYKESQQQPAPAAEPEPPRSRAVARQIINLDDAIEDDSFEEEQEATASPELRRREPARVEGKEEGKMSRKIEVDIEALKEDYLNRMPWPELVKKHGASRTRLHSELKTAGVASRGWVGSGASKPTRAARQPKQASRAMVRAPVAGLAAAEAATPAAVNGSGAHLRFRVVHCEASADSAALTEALRALTAALTERS